MAYVVGSRERETVRFYTDRHEAGHVLEKRSRGEQLTKPLESPLARMMAKSVEKRLTHDVALLYLARTGVPWRDLPAEFGNWDAVYNRFRRWVRSGRLKALFEGMTADPAFGDNRRVLIDSTVVRAHQHAAGARRKKKLGRQT